MKIKYTLLLVFCAFLIQSCKKDSITATTTTTTPISPFQAYINGTLWAPDTLSAVVNYNTTTKTKVLTCQGTKDQKQVNIAITNSNSTNSNSFPVGTYTTNASFNYLTQQKNVNGAYVFVPFGIVKDGSQSVVVSAVDTVKKTLTGTFNFISTNTVYDTNGNFVSIAIATIQTGTFTSLPYTYKAN